MPTPAEIIEEAVRVAEDQHKRDNDPTSKYWGYRLYAKAATDALLEDAIVASAARALLDDQERRGTSSALGSLILSPKDCEDIARVVLRSVGGG